MFSMCSELTPRAHIPDTRIPQLMQPCPRVSKQGVGVATPPQTLNISGGGLQLEMVYHVTTLSGL